MNFRLQCAWYWRIFEFCTCCGSASLCLPLNQFLLSVTAICKNVTMCVSMVDNFLLLRFKTHIKPAIFCIIYFYIYQLCQWSYSAQQLEKKDPEYEMASHSSFWCFSNNCQINIRICYPPLSSYVLWKALKI